MASGWAQAGRARGRTVTSVIVALLAVVPAAAAVTACSAKHDPPPGELLLAIDSNLKVPDDVDEIGIAIASADGKTITTDELYGMAPAGDAKFPATLAIIRGTSGPIDIKVAGYKNSGAFVLRETVTTIPSDRTAVLRVDLNWLDNHTATGSGAPGSSVLSLEGTCATGQTSIAGTCSSFQLDSATLPTFTSGAVVASDDTSACMNVTDCLLGGGTAGGSVTVPASALTGGTAADGAPRCTVAPPPVAGAYNIGLQLPAGGDGWCNATSCVVPLENVAVDGWQLGSNGVIALPASVCTNAEVAALVFTPISDACPQYVSGHPACQSYGKDGGATAEAGPVGDATLADASDAGAMDGATVPPGDATSEAGPAPVDDSINVPGYHLLGFASDDSESTLVAMMREDAGGGALVVWHDVPGQPIGTGVTVPLSDRPFDTSAPIDVAAGAGVFAYSASNAVQALHAAMPPTDAGYLGGSFSTPNNLLYLAADGGPRLVFGGFDSMTEPALVVQQADGALVQDPVSPGPVSALAPGASGTFAIAEYNTAVSTGYSITLGKVTDANPAGNTPPVVVSSLVITAVAFPAADTLTWWSTSGNESYYLFYAPVAATNSGGSQIMGAPSIFRGPRSMVGGGGRLFWIGAADQHINMLTFAAGAVKGTFVDLSALSLKNVAATQLGLTSMHLLYTDGETLYRYPLQDLP